MTESIASWLARFGFDRYASAFEAADVDLDVLPELTESDLEQLGVSLGDRKRLRRALTGTTPAASAEPSVLDGAGERRQISVVFCDLVDSTALAARLDPEDLRTVVSAYHECCTAVVASHGGEVAQFLGDGVMVQFGFPRAHEDDAERAIRCALAMVAAVPALAAADGTPLRARAGVATGTEVVGDLRGSSRDRASVVGITPSRASRLQGVAEPGTVVIGAATRRLVGGAFALTALGSHAVKGIGEVDLWRADGEAHGASRFASHGSGARTRLVGRETEVALLEARFRRACDGDGQAVVLTADAGVGKSRILDAFVTSESARGVARVDLQCAPHYATSALHPVSAFLETIAGIAPSDDPNERAAKIDALLPHVAGDAVRAATALSFLLSLPERDATARTLTAAQRKAAIFDAFLEELVARARERPVVVVVEDVHWIDATTLELLTRAIEASRRERVFIVVTCRPEFESPWTHDGNVTVLHLNRLERGDVETMVDDLCRGKALPRPLLAHIVDRADGIALFVEELTKSILESNAVRERSDRFALATADDRVAIPETLRDALTARLDAVPEMRSVAQFGAVIGREFSEELIVAVSEWDVAPLRAALERLVASGLLVRRQMAAGAGFAFKHALVRDTAYDGMLRAQRQQTHLRAARTIGRDPTIAEAEPEVLALHLEAGGDAAGALLAWRRAADRAISRSAYREASSHYDRALALTRHVEPDDGTTGLELLNGLGVVYCVLEGPRSQTARDCYDRAWTIAREMPESRNTFIALWGVCFCEYMSGLAHAALEKATTLIALADRLGEPDLVLEGLHAKWAAAFCVGDIASVLDATARGSAIYRPDLHHEHVTTFGSGHDSGICGLGHGAMALGLAGRIAESRRWRERMDALRERLDHPFTHAIGRSHASLARFMIADYEAAATNASENYTYAAERDFKMPAAMALLIEGAASVELGDLGRGASVLERLNGSEGAALPAYFRPIGLVRQAIASLAGDDIATTEAVLERAETSARELGGCVMASEVERLWAKLERRRGDAAAAGERIRRAIDVATSDGTYLLALRAAVDDAEHARRDDPKRVAATRALVETLLERIDGGDGSRDVARAIAVLGAPVTTTSVRTAP